MKTSVLALSFLLCFSCTKKLDEETCLPLKESIEVDSKVENIDILNKLLSAFRNIESVYDVNRKRG